MIKKYKIFAVIASLILLFPSCNLDELPKDSISLEDAWQSVDDAKNFRTGIYAYFRSINGGLYSYTPDYQSDLFNATIGYGNRGGEMHRWDFNSSQYDIEDTWQYNYYTINNCNNIINNIDNIEEDDAILATIKGEAYLMRAICYHTLVVRFAKDYDPSTAASNLGLPLVYNNDPTEKPSRSTLEETYTQIKEDITEARKYLTTAGAPNAEYFTKDVIDAFEARVNLYMHQYAGAVTLAKNIISAYPLLQSENDLKNMWLNDQSSEIIFRTFMSISERTNDMTNFLGYSTSANAFQPDFVPSQWVLDLYENSDIRKGTYFKKDKIVSNNVETNDVYMLNKYPGNPALKKTEYEYYHMWKVFRAAEAYLIAAEASYLNGDETGAIKYLNDLRGKRGASQLSALSGNALFDAIKKEWIREFVGEGQRLNDLKRWGDGMKRHDPQNMSILMTGNEYTTLSVENNNPRFVWEIPANDLKANSNLKPNW
ncbi:MAG: RagB/SusD family nutrient uptake outer membrane protein [Odoribacter sp.]|nr:RagB/SusD family nutrient uptake outer membrane protein [Odoribacter sp.]MDE6877741.1 RagB/SusD family nutrient uptake outer membrane protein [Odoribacter sp.]